MPTQPKNFWQRIQNFLTDKNRVGTKRGQAPDVPPRNAVSAPDYPVKGGKTGTAAPNTIPTRTTRAPSGQVIEHPGEEPSTPLPSRNFGKVGAEPGSPITTPKIGNLADTAIPRLGRTEEIETTRANASLRRTMGSVAGREEDVNAAIGRGEAGATGYARQALTTAEAGKADVENLPAQVARATEGIVNKFTATTNVDIGKIESLGREAVGMAMDGKNAAAQAAVEAQQGSVRNAIAQINSDPSIPQSRKTAMIAQIQTQGSMQIASTIGANIKDFTALQTGAMTSTMNAVGSAMTSRDAVLGQLGGARINAITSAHETAAQLSKGYDDMAVTARGNAEQLKSNYANLREVAAQTNNQIDMQLLADDHYVGGMPVDFQLTNLQLTRDMMQSDFAMQLQSRGFKTMEEAIAKGDAWAKQTLLYQALAPSMSGPMALGLSFLAPMLTGSGGAGGGGGGGLFGDGGKK